MFHGKWSFSQSPNVVQIDAGTGQLKVAAAPGDGSGNLNAYGTSAAFVLQGSNGKYVVAAGNGYAATAAASSPCNQFTLESADGGAFRIVDLGTSGQGSPAYWNVVNGIIQPLAKAPSPPATTSFAQTIVTPGLQSILNGGLPSQPDLTWVDVSGTDFTQAQGLLDFTQATLTHADFSGTQFQGGTGFDTSSGQFVSFANAQLAGCSFGTGHWENSNFTSANLNGGDVSGAWFNDATLDGLKLGQQSNLAGTHFNGASLKGANLTNAGNIDATDFTGADLTGAVFTGSSVTGPLILKGANLTNATLNNGLYWQITDGANSYVIVQGFGQAWYGVSLGVAPGTNYNAKSQFFIPQSFRTVLQTGPVPDSVKAAFKQYGNVTLSATASQAVKTYVTIYPKMIQLDQHTNFTGANLQSIDFTGYDLSNMILAHSDFTGAKLDNTNLTGTDMSYGNFSGVTFTGGIALFGATLSNANFSNADLTSAQMGAIGELFVVPGSSQAEYTKFLNALTNNVPADVKAVFGDYHVTLTNPVIIPSVFAPGRDWSIRDGQQAYTVRLVTSGSGANSLQVSQPTTAAVLTNAFMLGATLTSANLYQVRASGIQLYGGARLDGNAILEGAQFNNGNLAGINLKQAALYGCNFDYCILNNANFTGALLTPSASGGQASFNSANLQGAVFSDSQLANAIFTDAAVSVLFPASNQAAGVWQFGVESQIASPLITELQTASNPQYNFTLDPQAANVLKPGVVPSVIIKNFQPHGIPLSPTAVVSVMGEGAYWQIADSGTQYTIFETCDQANYVPSLGVAVGTSPLVTPQFFIPYSLESSLRPGPVAPSIVSAFQNYGGVTLGTAAAVSVLQQATDWQIADISGNYSLWLGLTMSCALKVTVAPSTPGLQQVFTNASTPLSRRATISFNKSGSYWAINNDSDNPFNPIVNYIAFNVVQTASGGLDVYGSKLRIRRLTGGNQQEYQNIACQATVLSPSDLVDSTTCPNSMTVKSNTTDKLPVNEWMRSRVLPRPPLCVPSADGTYYCPR